MTQLYGPRHATRHRVLLIDDHAPFRAILRQLLEPEFTVVAELASGEHAIQTVEASHPDLVLLDIALPERNGFEIMRDLLRSFPNLPVILVTTHTDRVYREEAFKRGAADFVPKGQISRELRPAAWRALAA